MDAETKQALNHLSNLFNQLRGAQKEKDAETARVLGDLGNRVGQLEDWASKQGADPEAHGQVVEGKVVAGGGGNKGPAGDAAAIERKIRQSNRVPEPDDEG